MKLSTLAIAIAIGGLSASGAALAGKGDNTVIDGLFSNRTDTQPSGSGDTILDMCGASSGKQQATLEVTQSGSSSKVEIQVSDARPDTVYTVWVRMKGTADGTGLDFGGSSLTGGGATPLAPGSDLPTLMANSPGANPTGTTNPVNGFTTDANGDADWSINLDFPVQGGAYPFNAVGAAPVAIVDPTQYGVSAPFLMRVVSHCQDDAAHGLSPSGSNAKDSYGDIIYDANGDGKRDGREAWFQYP